MSAETQRLVTGMRRVTNWVTALTVETDVEPSHTSVPVYKLASAGRAVLRLGLPEASLRRRSC